MIDLLKSLNLKKAAAREAAVTNVPAVGQAAAAREATSKAASAPAAVVASSPARYEVRENQDGWSIHDRQTGTLAETYGYRLARMSQQRAESLVAVLNRGEARRRGRNG